MKSALVWFCILGSVLTALLANSLSAIWASGDEKFSLWLLAVLLLSPIVFITFGLVTSKFGLAISSGVIDSLLTISTITVGLVFFHEWHKVSPLQFLGIAFAITGIFLMLFATKTGT